MKKGKVLSFSPVKNWGFIRETATRIEYFFHGDDVLGLVPIPGDAVTFELGVSAQGRTKAVEVQVVKP